MRLKSIILIICSLLFTIRSLGQGGELLQSRVLILLDGSSSMLEDWSPEKIKFKVAGEVIDRIIDSIYKVNDQVEFGLRVLGHQHHTRENDCYDTKMEVAFSKSNRTQMSFRVEDIHPKGITPLAFALKEAAEKDLIDEEHYAYSIILITDGGESCGGDICEVMRKMMLKKIFFKPYILSLEDAPDLKRQYDCMGNYLTITRKGDITKAVNKIVESFRPIIKITKEDYIELKRSGPPPQKEEPKEDVKPIDTVKKIVPINPEPTAVRPKSVKMKRLKQLGLKTLPIAKIASLNTQVLNLTAPVLKAEEVPVVKAAPVKLVALSMPTVQPFFTAPVKAPKFAKIKLGAAPTIELAPEVVPVKLEKVATPALSLINGSEPTVFKPRKSKVKAPAALVDNTEPDEPEIKKVKMEAMEMPKLAKLTVSDGGEWRPKKVKTKQPKALVDNTEPDVAPAPPVALTVLAMPKLKTLNTDDAITWTPRKVKTKQPKALVDNTEPEFERPAPVSLKSMSLSTNLKMLPTEQDMKLPKIRKYKLIQPKLVIKEEPVAEVPKKEEPKKEEPVAEVPKKEEPKAPKVVLARVKRLPPKKFGQIFILDQMFPKVKIGAIPKLKVKEEQSSSSTVKPSVKPAVELTKVDYTMDHEDATETTVQLYFTNGKGRFYHTTPQLILLDKANAAELKKFFRTVDGAGNPDPITTLPTGKYDMSFTNKRNLIMKDVDIQPNKHNKIYIKIRSSNLIFVYEGDPKRPVSEFTARVIERNVPNGKVVIQKCTEELEYDPGNYHININTLPEDVRYVDLDVADMTATVITIPRPGYLKVTNESPAKSVSLFKEFGDKYVQFHTLNMDDPNIGHLLIQPGKYQVHYKGGPTNFGSGDKVLPFTIKSDTETEVILK